MQIKIINNSKHPLPNHQTQESAGVDIRADLRDTILIKPLERVLVPTGLFIELPSKAEAQIRPRSGLAFKHGVTVLNSPGTIDSDYRGEIKVLLVNLSKEDFLIQDGERIAQMVVSKHEQIEWLLVNELAETERAAGGFGSTGKN